MSDPHSADNSPNISIIMDMETVATSYSAGTRSESAFSMECPRCPPNTCQNTVAGSVNGSTGLPDTNYVLFKCQSNTTATDYSARDENALESSNMSFTSVDTATTELTLEHSDWAEAAEELVRNGLRRLAQLASDEHKKDAQKSVEDYYSERLIKLVKEGPVHFNRDSMN